MVVELIVNRGWSVLVDGQKPKSPWNAPDEWGWFDPPLLIDRLSWNDAIGKIALMRQSGGIVTIDAADWSGEDEFGPMRPSRVIVEVNGEFHNLKITHIVYGADNGELLITTADGAQHNIDEITTYIRAEG